MATRAAAKKAAPRSRPIRDGRLKQYLDATKKESVLIGRVDRFLQLRVEERDATVIHPSEMASSDWCYRATYLRLIGKESKPQVISLRPGLIFAEGTEIGAKWQQWLREMGILWGKWECRICEETTLAWSRDLADLSNTPFCPGRAYQGPHLWKYKEVPLESQPKYNVAGHADGIVDVDGEILPIENKSIGPGTIRLLDLLGEHEPDEMSSDKFSRITRPLASHFRQTQIYLRLSNEMYSESLGPIDRGLVIYEHKADQQVREFVVERNDRWTNRLFEAAGDIVWAIERGRDVKCQHGGCAKCRAFE